MILTFSEQNFSNPEGGVFFKLRSQRNLQYREAFLQFQINGDRAELVSTLKDIIEDT